MPLVPLTETKGGSVSAINAMGPTGLRKPKDVKKKSKEVIVKPNTSLIQGTSSSSTSLNNSQQQLPSLTMGGVAHTNDPPPDSSTANPHKNSLLARYVDSYNSSFLQEFPLYQKSKLSKGEGRCH